MLCVISSSNEPSSGLMNGRIDATLLPSSHPETMPESMVMHYSAP